MKRRWKAEEKVNRERKEEGNVTVNGDFRWFGFLFECLGHGNNRLATYPISWKSTHVKRRK